MPDKLLIIPLLILAASAALSAGDQNSKQPFLAVPGSNRTTTSSAQASYSRTISPGACPDNVFTRISRPWFETIRSVASPSRFQFAMTDKFPFREKSGGANIRFEYVRVTSETMSVPSPARRKCEIAVNSVTVTTTRIAANGIGNVPLHEASIHPIPPCCYTSRKQFKGQPLKTSPPRRRATSLTSPRDAPCEESRLATAFKMRPNSVIAWRCESVCKSNSVTSLHFFVKLHELQGIWFSFHPLCEQGLLQRSIGLVRRSP